MLSNFQNCYNFILDDIFDYVSIDCIFIIYIYLMVRQNTLNPVKEAYELLNLF